jgi:hypothetical protein
MKVASPEIFRSIVNYVTEIKGRSQRIGSAKYAGIASHNKYGAQKWRGISPVITDKTATRGEAANLAATLREMETKVVAIRDLPIWMISSAN